MKSNLQNRSIYCRDNIDVLQNINSKCVDLLYLDPPFNKKKVFTAPIGSRAEGASFKDDFREADLKKEWLKTIQEDRDELYSFLMGIRDYGNKYNFCYLAYMAIRLIECHRILKDTGSLYLHCDPTMSHYLKILLDCVFGEKNFRNEIVWCYPPGGRAPKFGFHQKHDLIFYYSKSAAPRFHHQFRPLSDYQIGKFTKVDSEGRRFKEYRSKTRTYLDKMPGSPIPSWWTDISSLGQTISKERTGYPTQKPLALLERIIQASSKKGDLVLDPFCGCATTCIASEKLERKWVGIDISIKAYELVQERLKKEVANPEELFDYNKALRFSTDPPSRTDQGKDDREKKYVYIISNPVFPGIYKIGVAKDWQARLKSFHTGAPSDYKLEYKKLTPHYKETEKYVLERYRYNREWCKGDLAKIKKAIKDFDKSYLL